MHREKLFEDALAFRDSIARQHRRREMLKWRMDREEQDMLAQFSRSSGTGAHVKEALPYSELDV